MNMKWWYPSMWIRNEPTSRALSEFILSSLELGHRPVIDNADPYTMKLCGIVLWRSNWPYAYGNIYNPRSSGIKNFLPSRKAACELRIAELNEVDDSETATREYIELNKTLYVSK